MSATQYDVLGIGNAIVDVIARTDDDFLAKHGMNKGGMMLIDEPRAEAIYASMGPAIESSGGSGANTIAGVASFGARAAFVGKVKDDKLGMARDLALVEHDVLLRIDAGRNERRRHLARALPQHVRPAPYIDRHRDGMQVDDAIDAVVALLQRHELHDRAKIIAKMQVPGRLHPGKHALFERHNGLPIAARPMPR